MVITVQITPDGKATEMSSEEADAQKGERIYSGAALNAPEHWEHNQYRLTMTMPDTFDYDEDDMNVLATTIYRCVLSGDYMPDDIIFGTVYIANETADNIINFTKADLTYSCKQVFKKTNTPKRLKDISHIVYMYICIHGEHDRNIQQGRGSEAIEGGGAQQVQQRLLPRSQKGVGARALQEDLLERQRSEETPSKKPQVQAAASYGDNREVQKEREDR